MLYTVNELINQYRELETKDVDDKLQQFFEIRKQLVALKDWHTHQAEQANDLALHLTSKGY